VTLRALGIVRMSELKGRAQTGPARQRQDIEAKARELGADLIHVAEDLAVSAFKIPPLQRPKLAEWLNRTDDYEILIYWKQDRFVRRLVPDFFQMIMWAQQHKIRLISATEPFGDPTQHAEQMVPIMHAWLGQGESENESQRMINTQRYLREVGRWTGGAVPFGYLAVPAPSGKGFVLRIDPAAAAVIREALRRVIDGEALTAITADFNRRGIPTPRDHQRLQAGKAPGKPKRDGSGALIFGKDGEPERVPVAWHTSSLQKILRSEALIGRIRHYGETVRGIDGRPVRRAEPIITREEWNHLQTALDDPARRRVKRRVQDPSLVLRVAFCALCAAPMYRWVNVKANGKAHAYYRCRTSYRRAEQRGDCPSLPVPGTWLEDLATSLFLTQVGEVELLKRHAVPGDVHAAELEEIGKAIADLTTDRYVKGITREDYDAVLAGLQSEHSRLSELPSLPPRIEYRPTGKTFRQLWDATTDTGARRQLMTEAGFRMEVARTTRGTEVAYSLDEDLARRAGLAASGRPVTVSPARAESPHVTPASRAAI
jgi:site-specific DNA recombinase